MQQQLEHVFMKCSDNAGLRRYLMSEIIGSAVTEIVFNHVSNKKHLMTPEEIVSRCRLLPVHMSGTNVGFIELETNKVDSDKIILSGDFKPLQDNVVIPYKNIPMLKIGKGRRLRLTLTVEKGVPKQHTLFTTVATVATCGHGWLHVGTTGTKPMDDIIHECMVFYKDLEVSKSCNECTG